MKNVLFILFGLFLLVSCEKENDGEDVILNKKDYVMYVGDESIIGKTDCTSI